MTGSFTNISMICWKKIAKRVSAFREKRELVSDFRENKCILQLKRGNLSQECIGVKEVRTNRSTYNKSINFLSLISISYNFPFIIYWSQRTGDLNTLIINGDLSSRQIRGDWGVSRERPEDPASASRSSSGPGDGREFSFGGKGNHRNHCGDILASRQGGSYDFETFSKHLFSQRTPGKEVRLLPRVWLRFLFFTAERQPRLIGCRHVPGTF